MNRRSFLMAATVTGTSLLSQSVSGGSDGEIRYIAGSRTINKKEVSNEGATPEREHIYETIPRQKENRIQAQESICEAVATRLQEMGESKDVELVIREFHAINHPSKPFRPGLKLKYTSRSGISPSIPFEKVRDEFAGDYRGKDNRGNEHSVRVSVEKATESEVSETDPCYNAGDYSKDFEYVPGGVDVTANGDNGGTICAPFYDSGDGGAHWITAAHLFSGTGISEKARQPFDISTDSDTEYIGYCNQRDYGGNALNADDMAAIKDYNTSSYRDYVYGAGNCGDSHRIMGARSNQWLRNNQSSRAIYRQGSHSGRTAASFNYRPNTYRLTSPELVLNEEVEFGDSGGPYFDVTYDGEYNEYVAYICGVIARKVDGNEETESIGNTAQAVESTFDGKFF